MIGLFDGLKIGAGFIVGAALASTPAYLHGKSAGKRETSIAALEKTVEVIQSREITNAEITDSDAASLCSHFELQDDERRECVRRLAAASANAGNSPENHNGR